MIMGWTESFQNLSRETSKMDNNAITVIKKEVTYVYI